MIIRKWNGTDTWAAQSVETDLRSLRTTNAKLGSTNEIDKPFDTNYKLKVAHLPDSVFGGMVFVGTVSASGTTNNTLDLNELISESVANSGVISVSQQLDDLTSLNYGSDGSDYNDIGQRYVGHYWIVSGSNPVNFGDADDTSGTWATGAKDDGSDPGALGSAYLYAEAGDWIIITGWDNTNKQWSFNIINNTYRAASTSNPGLMSSADKSKLDGIAASANNYTHPTYAGDDINIDTGALTGATVISDLDFNITSDTQGHITDANATIATRTLTLANLGYTGATDANNYVHPTYDGDDFSIDTGALTGAYVISDLDINVTSDSSGHITDANATVATRQLTLSDLGYSAPGNGTHTVSGTTDQVSIATAGGAFTANKGTTTTTTVSLSYPVYYAETQAGLSTDSSVPENAIGFEY